MTLKFALIAAAAALVTGPAVSAVSPRPPDTDPDKVPAGVYPIEPYHTRVLFSLSHMGFTTWYGEFTHVSGSLSIDPGQLGAATLSISIPVDAVSTSNAKLDGELRSPQWLDAGAYPTMTFTAVKIRRTGPSTADVTGDFTLHGVTRPITLAVKFNASGLNVVTKKTDVGFDATAHLKRSDFGVGQFAPMIGDDVSVIISAAFEK